MKTVFRLLSSIGRALGGRRFLSAIALATADPHRRQAFAKAAARRPASIGTSTPTPLFGAGFPRLLAIVLLCGGGVAAPAQLPPRDPAKVQAQAVRRQAADAARDLAARGDLAGAEQALRAVNYIQANTAAGHFETAQRLTQLAATLSRAGNAAGARAAALRALAVLEQADRLPRDTHLQAGIRRQIAFLQERYLGNPAAAKAAHRAAAALVPDHPSAREKVQQLDQAEANARSRAAAAPDRTAAPVRGAPRSPGRTTDLP